VTSDLLWKACLDQIHILYLQSHISLITLIIISDVGTKNSPTKFSLLQMFIGNCQRLLFNLYLLFHSQLLSVTTQDNSIFFSTFDIIKE